MTRTGRRSQRTRAVRICRRSESRLARRVRIRTRSSCTGRQCVRCSSWSMPLPFLSLWRSAPRQAFLLLFCIYDHNPTKRETRRETSVDEAAATASGGDAMDAARRHGGQQAHAPALLLVRLQARCVIVVPHVPDVSGASLGDQETKEQKPVDAGAASVSCGGTAS